MGNYIPVACKLGILLFVRRNGEQSLPILVWRIRTWIAIYYVRASTRFCSGSAWAGIIVVTGVTVPMPGRR